MPVQSLWERDYDLVAARRRSSTRTEAPHQEEALAALARWYATKPEEGAGGLLVLPTGGGKTFTAVRFLCRHPLSDGYKVLWLAHTHHLLEQALDAFGKRDDPLGVMEVGSIHEPKERLRARVVSGTVGHSRIAAIQADDDVVICTLQTAVRAYRDKHAALRSFLDASGGRLAVVFDEAHHAPAPSYTDFLMALRREAPQMKLLGLTATPMHNDERREGWLTRLFPQKIIFQVSAAKLVAARILAKPEVSTCQTAFVPEFDASEFERWRATYQDLPEGLITQLAENQTRNDAICRTYLEGRERFGKTIIFADRWFQCDYLREKLLAHGVRADVVYSHVDSTGATAAERNARSRDENARVLQSFRDGDLEVLINVRMLTEGTDVPSVQTVFVTRQTTSPILLRQMVGRALRGPKFSGTATANIVLFTDRWREAIQWAEFDDLWSAESAEGRIQPRKQLPLRLVSIDLVRRLARQMESGRVEATSFRDLLPVGWYVPEFDVEIAGSDDSVHQRQMVLVYDDERPAFEAFLNRLATCDLQRFADPAVTYDSTQADLEAWADEFFNGDGMGSTALGMNLFHLARHVAQSSDSPPPFYTLEQRDAHDLTPLVCQAADGDWGPMMTRQRLDPVYCDTSRFWRALFPTFDQFCNQFRLLVDGEIHRRHGGSSAPPKLEAIIAPAAELPDQEPTDEVKQEVLRRDGKGCLCCGSRRRLQIDHIVPRYLGGSNEPDNLQTLCATCNTGKGVRDMNFRKSGTLLSAPPALVFPAGFSSLDLEDLVCDVQRTINMFYQCAAVDLFEYATRGVRRREWSIRLCSGNPRAWLDEHLETIFDRVRQAQEGDPYGGLRSLVLESPSSDRSVGSDPTRVWADLVERRRPLGSARIVARRVVAVYFPSNTRFPNAFLRATVVRANPKAKTADVRVRLGRTEELWPEVPYSALFPPELVGTEAE